ncbi:peptidoglycan-binding domain-containing protein [Thiohalocapsa halophila]|uniref:peptidoglycan-binding domain-containing protein n=1 Tax=Thiohalocapsa halophila TaxID=69359 RepID=UPI001903F319|nr:peptidoglycan-binding domain-containing protein [Thiohalocapsa halophila]
MKRIIAAIIVLAGLDTCYAAEWKVSAAFADGEFARIVIDTTGELRVQCALKNASGTTIAAQPWTVHAPATEVIVATHGRSWETVTCSARDAAGSSVLPGLNQEPDVGSSEGANGFPTDGKNPVLEGDHSFAMSSDEWFAWNKSGIPECETVPIYAFDGADWREVLAWTQTRLTELGYDPGGIDGKDGPKTRAALHAFVADHGLVQDARLLELNVFAALISGTCFVPKVAHILKCDEAISSGPGWKLQLKLLDAGRGETLGKIQQEASERCISGEWNPKQVEQHLAERLNELP